MNQQINHDLKLEALEDAFQYLNEKYPVRDFKGLDVERALLLVAQEMWKRGYRKAKQEKEWFQ